MTHTQSLRYDDPYYCFHSKYLAFIHDPKGYILRFGAVATTHYNSLSAVGHSCKLSYHECKHDRNEWNLFVYIQVRLEPSSSHLNEFDA